MGYSREKIQSIGNKNLRLSLASALLIGTCSVVSRRYEKVIVANEVNLNSTSRTVKKDKKIIESLLQFNMRAGGLVKNNLLRLKDLSQDGDFKPKVCKKCTTMRDTIEK